MQSRLAKTDIGGMVYLKNTAKIEEGQLFTTYKDSTGLGEKDVMVLVKSESDAQGYTHNEYHQYYSDVRVEGAEVFEHLYKCYVEIVNGIIVEGLAISAIPDLTEEEALKIAADHLNAAEYAWENEDWELELQEDTGDPSATYYPSGALVLINLPGTSLQAANYRLAWKFKILSLDPIQSRTVYVNAIDGSIIKSFDNSTDNGPAVTLYDGSQTIDTKWAGGLFHGHHHLKSDDNNKKIITKNGTRTTWKSLNHIYDLDDNWASDQAVNTTAHWVVNQAWDYFRTSFDRSGMDNNNNEVRIFAGSSLGDNARRFNEGGKEYLEFGTTNGIFGVTGTNLATLDVGGHEFTHGITANEANLVYEGESGALNESFSDIFGVMTERFARGGTFNWTIGEDAGFVLRDMQTPASSFEPQPATFLTDQWWIPVVDCIPAGENDNCGVHTNSGVQNRWFFLLSQGGTQGGVAVQGIGPANAARIAYSNLCNFLGTNADHLAARAGAIAAARQLFGACSNEEIQTTNAWAAVGVGAPFVGPCLTLTGYPVICIDVAGGAGLYTAHAAPGASFTWDFPATWSAYTTGPGNNTLVITSVNMSSLPPLSASISVSSSLGGTVVMQIIFEKCREKELNECGIKERNAIRRDQQSLVEEAVTLYPNPAKDILQLNAPGKNIHKITVYSSLGIKIKELATSGDILSFDISTWPNGSYFISVELDEETLVKRFIKAD